MKKILSLFALVLVLSSCANPPVSEEKTNPELNTPSAAVKTPDQEPGNDYDYEACITGCNQMWLANEGNKDKPSSQMDTDCQNLCMAAKGMEEQSAESCEKSEGILKDTCYADLANSQEDPSICENIVDITFKDSCYLDLAESMMDKTLCEKITNQTFKDLCQKN